jgi:hypothetical protein
MIRGILTFFAVWAMVFFGFSFFWHTSLKEKVEMFKVVAYSLLTSIVALVIVVSIVILF